MNPAALPAPTFDDLRAAAQRLHGIAHRTPVLRSTSADESTGAQVFFKCENLQRTGAFKFRGAYNTLAQFTPEQRERGVLAFSAGNHAQAIALSARLLDMPAVIVMPEDAPASKMAATREYGAQVVTYNQSLIQLRGWAGRVAEAGAFGQMESLILQIGFGEYLNQIAGGIPMSQIEVARLSDLGVSWTPSEAARTLAGARLSVTAATKAQA